MTKSETIVLVAEEPGARAEEEPCSEHQLAVGQWYWISHAGPIDRPDADTWLGCIVQVGSNYASMRGVRYIDRIHFDEFWIRCKRVADAERIIQEHIAQARVRAQELMGKVRALTAGLSVAWGPALPEAQGPSETQALALRTREPMDAYKQSLIKAERQTLPELFKQIADANKEMADWMGATMIPMEAQVEAMKPAIDAVKRRIFSVELYAGLTEEVVAIAKGEPAPAETPIHLMQRRLYQDEEILSRYHPTGLSGGMEFKDIAAFDQWLLSPENRDRILPFPRCVVAFRVRRQAKEREMVDLSDFIEILYAREADQATFLYLRNGGKLYRLKTGIEFGEKLFPDMDMHVLNRGKLWARFFGDRFDRDHTLISDDEYQAMVRTEQEEDARREALGRSPEHFHASRDYKPFTQESVYYDDIAREVKRQIDEHNRLVLVLQGLLNRSDVFAPHPPWGLWSDDGFRCALKLVYDDSRTLTTGDKPDFEAYRARCNETLRAGSMTVGQELAWLRHEGQKESAHRDGDHRWARNRDRPKTYRPPGNPGPGVVAKVDAYAPRARTCTYQWSRRRQTPPYDAPMPTSFTTAAGTVLNIDAYQPGDFRQFFDDPRTRAEYLEWAPLLLVAEEYKAGRRTFRGDE